jgi:hypothetical protein
VEASALSFFCPAGFLIFSEPCNLDYRSSISGMVIASQLVIVRYGGVQNIPV